MKPGFTIILMLLSTSLISQTIKDERAISYVYGKGNSDISIVFEGNWQNNTETHSADYKYQILETSNINSIKQIDSSQLYGVCHVKSFRDLDCWTCVRDSLLITQSQNYTLVASYNATTNPSRTDLTTLNSFLQPYGTTNGHDGKINQYGFIVPGTFVLTAGSLTIADDGNGHLIGNVGAASTINYGYNSYAYINLTFSSLVLKTTPVNVSFTYKRFPYLPYNGFLTLKDLPARIFTFIFFDNAGNKLDSNFSIDGIRTLKISKESNYQYTNQTVILQ